MQPHQERVVAESNELRDRLLKLTSFISKGEVFDTLPEEDKSLLREQRNLMDEYLDVLRRRIERFT
jgi:hypothetical protein